MSQFLNDDFLLDNSTAKKLYHQYAADMPIYDYHCHLSPKEIADDKQFVDLAEIWLGGDHYKWRLMREYGIDEKYISGTASNWEKFEKFASVLPYCIGNPVYVWCHLELKRFFGIDTILTPDTAKVIWEQANAKLKLLTAKKLIKNSNVKYIYTTDDPCDNLQDHATIAKDKDFGVVVAPAFRPDKLLNAHLPTFVPYIKKLGQVVGYEIKTLDDLLKATASRIEFFDKAGCRCSDHALDNVPLVNVDQSIAAQAFDSAMKGNGANADQFRSFMLVFLGEQYQKYGWAQQYHIAALRNLSSFAMKQLGPDTGYDAINDPNIATQLTALLDAQATKGKLPKTILYSNNPTHNEVLASIKNCFSQVGVSAKIQLGSAWWFNDQRDGIDRQLEALSQFGLLSKFVGMLTDSRSFLSYPRHEYFRRVLCQKLGLLIESGQYPMDIEFVGKIVQDICFYNVVEYFKK